MGADSPFGDEPFVQTWGRPETSGVRLFLNSGYDISADAELYATGNFADTDGRFRFFYRNPSHSSLTSLVDNFGYSGPLLNTCLLYTSPSPRDKRQSRMPSSA